LARVSSGARPLAETPHLTKQLLVLIASYLLGSIPFGYLIVRAAKGGDVRRSGSGATGATNVARRAGKLAGLVTLLLDAVKGWLAIEIARHFLAPGGGVNWWVAGAALITIFAHVFPIWLGFRGGKGVATALGVFVGLYPLGVPFAAVVFVLVALATRYVSLASISATASFPIIVWSMGRYVKPVEGLTEVLSASLVGGALIIVMHRSNIARLIAGKENKFH
jgi:acyl phosphate:glycerol-3-phosphate acyltransferase